MAPNVDVALAPYGAPCLSIPWKVARAARYWSDPENVAGPADVPTPPNCRFERRMRNNPEQAHMQICIRAAFDNLREIGYAANSKPSAKTLVELCATFGADANISECGDSISIDGDLPTIAVWLFLHIIRTTEIVTRSRPSYFRKKSKMSQHED